MINFGIFDVDWSLKNELVALGFDRKKEIDPFDLLYRVFFEPDFNTCWKNYKDRAKWFAQEPPLNKERLSFVYDYVHQVCGPTYEHSTYIFLIESLLELRVINNVLKKGCSIRNVYDCFFFKTSEISEEEIKDIIQEEALATYQLFKKKDN